ncbi:MAG: geranylgeranylglycerol-phosphate geranylgeranyltransferase [Bacteroidales bacterium]|nr:geranylgeranylglycerol-phosphate geranylgeranyltransferase [Bacteroidales bacterium]
MEKFKAYLKLLRLPNLVIIVLTQYMLRWCIIEPFYEKMGVDLQMDNLAFFLLVLTSVLMASAGYVINDYFDFRIDRVNKPEKVVVGRKVPFNRAIFMHWGLNIVGVLIGLYLSYRIHSWKMGLIFIAIPLMLWFYSLRYKRIMLWGNLMISFLSAMIVLMVWLFEFMNLRMHPTAFTEAAHIVPVINTFVWAYALFAFIFSFIREMIKDLEDMEGDLQNGCRTLPIVAGTKTTRIIITILVIIAVGLLVYGITHLFQRNFLAAVWYYGIVVTIPAISLLFQFNSSSVKEQYHVSSNITKIIMFTGIIGMQMICMGM